MYGLRNRPALDPATAKELDAFLSVLRAAWSAEHNDDGTPQSATPPPSTSQPSTSSSSKKAATPAKKKAKSKPKLARLTIVATGQVYVCLKAAGKRTPVPGIVLTGGARQGPYKSSRFRVQLGTSEARLVVNGKFTLRHFHR